MKETLPTAARTEEHLLVEAVSWFGIASVKLRFVIFGNIFSAEKYQHMIQQQVGPNAVYLDYHNHLNRAWSFSDHIQNVEVDRPAEFLISSHPH